ncbi:ABC transporter permease [Geminicoccus harenae]|uniref:ABC transporter permease n=1 Tax=Geminicoccus harenae TaxID=2498453 RepID=UPI00168B11F7|nr:ABC transporter permease [Geminicoccus harenae]
MATILARTAAPGSRARWHPFRLGLPFAGIALPVLLALLLELGAATGWLQSRFLPPPSRIFATLAGLWTTGDLAGHILITLWRVALGFLFGALAATVLGMVAGASPLWRRWVDPTLQGLRSIPSIAWVPLFILWFGIFETPKIVLIALGAFFPVYLSLSTALREVDRKLVEVGQVNGFDRLTILRRIMLPAALPGWVVGLRGGLALGWMFVIAAELMGASAGVGYLLLDGQMTGNAAQIVGCLCLFALLGRLSDLVLVMLARPFMTWQDSVAEREQIA